MKKIRRWPWGILAGSFGIALFYLTLAVVVLFVVFSGIKGQTHETATLFDSWYQTLLFWLDIFSALGFLFSLVMYILRVRSFKKDARPLPPKEAR